MAFAELLERAGGVGLFQTLQVFTLLLSSIFVPFQILVDNFSAAVPSHRCWVPLLDNSTAQASDPGALGPEALLAVSIPLGPNQEPHQCRRFRHPQWQLLDPNTTATNWSEAATEPCVDGWVYDRSTFASTIVAEWGLVCDSQSLKPMGQAFFMAGTLLGSFTWGLLSYWFGRKPMLCWCCLQVAVASTSTVFAPNFLIYYGLRVLSAFGLAGIVLTTTTLLVEWTTIRRRDFTMMILGCTYSLGQMALGGLAFTLRDWRVLQLAVSIPLFAIFLISCSLSLIGFTLTSLVGPVGIRVSEDQLRIWKDIVITIIFGATKIPEVRKYLLGWLPESARWLIITGKADRALRELRKVARINGHKEVKKTLTMEVLMSSMEEEVASARAHKSVLELFRVPTLRWRSCCLCVTSFSIMFSYYGLVLDLQNLGSDIFLLQVLFGAVDFLGRAANTFLLRFFGRRVVLASFHTLTGLSFLANILVPQDFQTLRVGFAVLGKGCFGVSFTCFAVYKPELFPTSLRMTADGFLHSVGQLGAVMSPLIRMTRQAMPLLTPLAYGVTPITSSLILLLFLPETRGLPLPDTIQDLEKQRPGAATGNQREAVITETTRF